MWFFARNEILLNFPLLLIKGAGCNMPTDSIESVHLLMPRGVMVARKVLVLEAMGSTPRYATSR